MVRLSFKLKKPRSDARLHLYLYVQPAPNRGFLKKISMPCKLFKFTSPIILAIAQHYKYKL